MRNDFNEINLFTDGGCRGNPGRGAIGFIILDEKNCELIRIGKCIGNTTNNRAEYQALINGLDCCKEFTKGKISCFLDSELVVSQVTGKWKIKDCILKKLYQEVVAKEKNFSKVTYEHLRRTDLRIEEVDKIVNLVLDQGKKNK